jgi:hypothetical protein
MPVELILMPRLFFAGSQIVHIEMVKPYSLYSYLQVRIIGQTQGHLRNYAFPLVLKKGNIKNRNLLEKILKKNKIEFRRGNAGGGNQLRQPYLKEYIKGINLKQFKEVDHIHFFGYYIGNYPSLKKDKILRICKILNNISYD